jgi:acylphosphatase
VAEKDNWQCRQVFYQGDVQGVGFRYTTLRIARSFQVTGFVRNLADGRVELKCEGRCQELEVFLAELARTMENFISQVEVSIEGVRGGYDRFEIR